MVLKILKKAKIYPSMLASLSFIVLRVGFRETIFDAGNKISLKIYAVYLNRLGKLYRLPAEALGLPATSQGCLELDGIFLSNNNSLLFGNK